MTAAWDDPYDSYSGRADDPYRQEQPSGRSTLPGGGRAARHARGNRAQDAGRPVQSDLSYGGAHAPYGNDPYGDGGYSHGNGRAGNGYGGNGQGGNGQGGNGHAGHNGHRADGGAGGGYDSYGGQNGYEQYYGRDAGTGSYRTRDGYERTQNGNGYDGSWDWNGTARTPPPQPPAPQPPAPRPLGAPGAPAPAAWSGGSGSQQWAGNDWQDASTSASGRWQTAPSGQWTPPPSPSSPSPRSPSSPYFGGQGTFTGQVAVLPQATSWSAQAAAAPAAPTAWPQRPSGRPAPGLPAPGGATSRSRSASWQPPARVTPSRASRHSRQAAATQRNQVLQRRLMAAGALIVAMVVCWFYVFPWLENILPSEF